MLVYISQDVVNSFVVQFAFHCILPQAGGDGAQVVQGCHPESHLCLLVTELMHLEEEKVKGKK